MNAKEISSEILLAKSPKEETVTLEKHSLDVYNYGCSLIDRLPFDKNERQKLKEQALIPLLFHDAGKAAAGFQEVLRTSSNWKGKRHEILSAAFCYQFGLSEEQLFAVITHHKDIDKLNRLDSQKRIDTEIEDGNDFEKMKKEFEENSENLIETYLNCLNRIDPRFEKQLENLKEQLIGYKGKELHSNWGIPNYWMKEPSQIEKISFENRSLASKLRGIVKAADHLASAHIEPGETISLKDYPVSSYGLRQFQKACSEYEGNLFLTAPTGSGKTEASLLWAQNNFKENARLFYVLPYQASINAMYRRLAEIFNSNEICHWDKNSDAEEENGFEKDSGLERKNDFKEKDGFKKQGVVGALHGNSVSFLYHLQNMEENEKAELESHLKSESHFKNETNPENKSDTAEMLKKQSLAKAQADLAREIYYQIRVCTPHQILRLGLRGKGWEFLYLEFHNALVIYDEVHAYDPQIVGSTLATAKMLLRLGCKICFMSATFPEFLKNLIREKLPEAQFNEIIPSSNFESDIKILNRKRHYVHVCDGSLENYFDNIQALAEGGKNILVIANHVKTAQFVYDSLAERGLELMLLHGRFNRRDRNEKEKRLLGKESDRPQIVVATQVIEVSLDIDYDIMFTEPAPIDALSQRFGRVNRKGLREPADIFVMSEQVSSHSLYNKERVAVTLECLSKITESIGEQDLLEIVNEVYKDGYDENEQKKFGLGFSDLIYDLEKYLVAGLSNNWLDIGFDSNYGYDILPYENLDEFIHYKENGCWIEANDLLITKRLDNKGGWMNNSLSENQKKYVYDIVVLDRYYDSEKGLSDDPSAGLKKAKFV
ncbi:MAG: CRISPR-associated helicase Cas3' [Methanosarcinales archaeon]|jgi:CRISPR-associated endonuclease/helicase Cas3|nr:CRISPR-associated helicase Cas3' [Methanosarcinales archaeon]